MRENARPSYACIRYTPSCGMLFPLWWLNRNKNVDIYTFPMHRTPADYFFACLLSHPVEPCESNYWEFLLLFFVVGLLFFFWLPSWLHWIRFLYICSNGGYLPSSGWNTARLSFSFGSWNSSMWLGVLTFGAIFCTLSLIRYTCITCPQAWTRSWNNCARMHRK